MNEVELIRAQLCVERQHAAAVSHVLAASADSRVTDRTASSVDAFRQAGVDYLEWTLTRFEAREQAYRDLLQARFTPEDPHRRAAEAAFALEGTSRDALAKLASALNARSEAALWTDYLRYFSGAWSTRRDELERVFESQAKVPDWRTVSGIDADSIFEERGRYARVRATLPAGVEMPALPGATRV